jgi:DNA polymerase
MSGDSSGRTFRHLMHVAGIQESEVFITNAVLCNPRSESGANRSPTRSEVSNCSSFLHRTIQSLDPPLVVAVGATALSALAKIEQHGLTLSRDVGMVAAWFGRWIAPLYHPSPQVLISRRNLAQQEDDWRRLGLRLAELR